MHASMFVIEKNENLLIDDEEYAAEVTVYHKELLNGYGEPGNEYVTISFDQADDLEIRVDDGKLVVEFIDIDGKTQIHTLADLTLVRIEDGLDSSD